MEKKVSKERILDDMAHASEQVRMECVCELLRGLMEKPFMLRKVLCDALYVASHYDDQALRDALEPIVRSR